MITGASRGIGSGLARRFAAEGCRVVLNYHRHEREALALAALLNRDACGQAPLALAVKADVSERAQVEEMFALAERTFGEVDVLINNAGIAQQKLFTDLTQDDWDRMFAVDVTGVFHCCQRALPGMIRRKAGKIINISSMWGQVGASCEVHYSAAKAAVIGLTKALAKEVGPCNIQVNCIAPGVIDTEMNRGLSPGAIAELKAETPLGTIGTVGNIADAAVFLAGSQSDFMTGQVLSVNGGMVI